MKIDEVEVGARYLAKVSGVITIVKVLAIREAWTASSRPDARRRKVIDVVNERTGRRTTFRSAARLRRKAETIALPQRAEGGAP